MESVKRKNPREEPMRTIECVILVALLAACGKKDGAAEEGNGHEDGDGHDHAAHAGPHDGEVLDLGGGAYHLEILHDHDGGNMTVYVLGADLKTPVPVAAPVVNLEKGPVQFTLTPIDPAPDGKAVAFKGSHEGLRSDPWEGRIVVKIGDKTYQSPLEGEGHDHDHDHK
jgi:hypothetical protein